MLFNQMRDAVESIMCEIQSHPFNTGLADGTLAQNKFIFYLEQDGLYLAEYFRALAFIGARLHNHEHARKFMQFALEALNAEKDLHSNYLRKCSSHRVEMAPSCFMYTNYLLRMANIASIEEAVASVLPCFWVYREVSKKMIQTSLNSNPYQAWIMLYSGEAFDHSVKAAIKILNQLGENSSMEIQKKMIAAFVKATQLEWMFWDAAWNLEKWKISCEKSESKVYDNHFKLEDIL
ncbi:MAG TPA: thiaminase II [Gammaproteobacteria bacterium]|nr:thiaminase II [Gammaproteobacteria bacterium]